MINLMNENDLAEIEVEREGTKIKLKKSAAEIAEVVHQAPPVFRTEVQPSQPSTDAPATSSGNNNHEIKSPMVGTFYRSPSPESPPFVEAGQVVEVGQVVCIVEAMKLMNEIKSEVRGKISEVLIENAQPVEFGQALFTVEPV